MLLRSCALAAFALCAGALALPAAPVPVHLMPKAELFYPTKVGAKHVSNWDNGELVDVVSKATPIEGGYEVEIERVSANGQRAHSETVLVTTRGLVRTHSGGKKLNKPCHLLVVPHAEGNSWKSQWGPQERTLRTAGWEEIEVPAGKFRAMRVDHTVVGNATIDSTHWYAPGIGCVSWYSISGKVGRPLKAFTPGK